MLICFCIQCTKKSLILWKWFHNCSHDTKTICKIKVMLWSELTSVLFSKIQLLVKQFIKKIFFYVDISHIFSFIRAMLLHVLWHLNFFMWKNTPRLLYYRYKEKGTEFELLQKKRISNSKINLINYHASTFCLFIFKPLDFYFWHSIWPYLLSLLVHSHVFSQPKKQIILCLC